MTVKSCGNCGDTDLINFRTRKYKIKSGEVRETLYSWCKKCTNEAAKRYRNEDRSKEWSREYNLRTKYGLTVAEYDLMLERQKGTCAICQRVPRQKRLAVDHDHNCCKAGASCGNCVRGLLCFYCNRGLGMFHENSDKLMRAVSYLRGDWDNL